MLHNHIGWARTHLRFRLSTWWYCFLTWRWSSVLAKFEGVVENLNEWTEMARKTTTSIGEPFPVVMGKICEIKIMMQIWKKHLFESRAYGASMLNVKMEQKITKSESLCKWESVNAVILSEFEVKLNWCKIVERSYLSKSIRMSNLGFPWESKLLIQKTRTKTLRSLSLWWWVQKVITSSWSSLISGIGEKVKGWSRFLVKIPRSIVKPVIYWWSFKSKLSLFERARNP